jgi:hypothetical protein
MWYSPDLYFILSFPSSFALCVSPIHSASLLYATGEKKEYNNIQNTKTCVFKIFAVSKLGSTTCVIEFEWRIDPNLKNTHSLTEQGTETLYYTILIHSLLYINYILVHYIVIQYGKCIINLYSTCSVCSSCLLDIALMSTTSCCQLLLQQCHDVTIAENSHL